MTLLHPATAVSVRILESGTDWPAWISAGAAAATLVIVVITAVFALFGLKDARRTRHGQLVVEVMRDWTSPDAKQAHVVHRDYSERQITALVDKVWGKGDEQPTPEDLTAWRDVSLIANLSEALGVLCSERALTPETVYKMWGGAILSGWRKWEEGVKRLRVYDEEPDTFFYFEEIASQMQRISAERKRASSRRTGKWTKIRRRAS